MSEYRYEASFKGGGGGHQKQQQHEHTEQHEHKAEQPFDTTAEHPNESIIKQTKQQHEQSDHPKGANKRAYITLVTRASYLAGVVILAHTLEMRGSKYPLIVLYTDSLTDAALLALDIEAKKSNLILKKCELLIPGEQHDLDIAVPRFEDTWTKIRVFEQFEDGFETLCYLDADMIVFKDMDTVFDGASELPKDHIRAVHDCICSPDREEWTPDHHCPENCPFNSAAYPGDLMTFNKEHLQRICRVFNSGMFVFHPNKALWEDILDYFTTNPFLGMFKFPDQDFLISYFTDKWAGLLWTYNAVKTMAYRHEKLWDKNEIVCLHYIVDKPWAKRIGPDGVAGFKGKDGETHSWWWDEYEAWVRPSLSFFPCHVRADHSRNLQSSLRQEQGAFEVVSIMSKHVARRDSESSDPGRPDMGVIGTNVHETEENDDTGRPRVQYVDKGTCTDEVKYVDKGTCTDEDFLSDSVDSRNSGDSQGYEYDADRSTDPNEYDEEEEDYNESAEDDYDEDEEEETPSDEGGDMEAGKATGVDEDGGSDVDTGDSGDSGGVPLPKSTEKEKDGGEDGTDSDV
ncbi:glycosyltransferase family 8 protein [Zasmidium cellare ATCC 36951]|uniref:Glycosyltransferase family 8 protein n=1 Tax=Zasmidium cellare ATCC 36951 TaxID=1080233 RepID=A0A6A6C206_ZASCE|nr:glycosyltransferase family 8 protein [Zasmidium cellare ATCC 36951]KAF2159872.1 glycosyltransferase family 8 protein [Zasmidium cellare ATCC 36951]